MNKIRIVEYEAKYQPYFEQLNRHWITKYFEIEPGDEYVLTMSGEAIIQPGGAILMALYDGHVAGTVGLKKESETVFEFTKMAVDENFQRKGIAEMLGYASFEKARELGARQVILYTNSKLRPAISLYVKLGFSRTMFSGAGYVRSDVKMTIDIEDALKAAGKYFSGSMETLSR